MPDAPHGKGRLVSGGYDSKKISKVSFQSSRNGGRRVKAAYFRKGGLNGGLLTSAGVGPDEFERDDSRNNFNGARERFHRNFESPVRCEAGQIASLVLSLKAKGYSEEKIMDEVNRSVQPELEEKQVTLTCRGCGRQTKRVLNIPPDVLIPENQPFICKDCVAPSKNRRATAKVCRDPKPQALAA